MPHMYIIIKIIIIIIIIIIIMVKTRSHSGIVVECRTKVPEIPGSTWCGQKEKILTGPTRAIPPPIPLHQS